MVLFKRKPVRLVPPPELKDDNVEVWHIPQTGEIFVTYEDFLARKEFYSQKRFICQITGHSGLNFLDALRSEQENATEVEAAFPEALKGPVLRRVQFQTVSRIDALVDLLFDQFKKDFYPGEAVTVDIISGERLHGVVRDKTRFGSKLLPDGTLTSPFSRYFVSLDDRPAEEAVVDDAHISRDRKVFTKSVLRSFIKRTVTREAWNGAPWLVKHDYAEQYHIDTRVPPHLRHDNKIMERKQLAAQKRALQPGDVNGTGNHANQSLGPMRLPELKPAPKNQKGKLQPPPVSGPKGKLPFGDSVMQAPTGNPFQFAVPLRNQAPAPPVIQREPTPPPPPPKYPIEDLQVPLRDGVVRPALHFMCQDPPVAVKNKLPLSEMIPMSAVGLLLETWDTLNVYCEVFKLDSFTFDDFVEAMCVVSEDVPVQLFDEIHCSVLKILVDSEADGGKVRIPLPEIEEDDDEEDDEDEESAEASPEPEPEPKPATRATRSSLARQEAERLAAEAAAAEREREKEAEPLIRHRAEDVLEDYDWIEELRKRRFPDGGWHRIIVGLLHQLSKFERYTQRCEDLLAQLVPPDVEPSQETVQEHYVTMELEYRVQALQLICMLTNETKAMRAYMEDCSEQMTAYRKDKIDWQRQRKQALEELRQLQDQRKILLPDNMPPSPPLEPTKADDDVRAIDTDESPADSNDSTDEDARSRRTRAPNNRAVKEKQRKREEEQRRKEEAEAAAAKAPKQSKQFIKVTKDIAKKEELIKQCEEEIAVIDNDLREADCGRTRVLGKDRFWNRYYWFERNGMPYGGLPTSSTAEAEYASGCIWVQGPDKLEYDGYLDVPVEQLNEYKAKFGMTVLERKRLEEGPTSVYNARQWGLYSKPQEVEDLLSWLDPRGFNELKLRKEILNYKDKIVLGMENRERYLSPAEEERKDEPKRMSTRGRTAPTPEPRTYRCLKWENTTALEELGHLHSEPPPPPRPKKQSRKREAHDPLPGPPPKTRRRY